MLTKVNTDMISDPSIVQSSEKLCEIFIALVSEVWGLGFKIVECVHYTTPDTCSPITTQMDPEYSNKYQSQLIIAISREMLQPRTAQE